MKFKSEKGVKVIISICLCLLVGVIFYFEPLFFKKIWYISTCGDIEEIVEYINSFGIWAMFFSFFLDVLVNALGFLPSIFISTANGILFGVVNGIIISWLAETVGVIISFILMRSFLREAAQKLIAQSMYLQKVDDFSSENGFKLMLIARTLPYFPSGILTALGAVSKMSFKDYALANLIGKFPSTALEVLVGHDAVRYQENMDRLLGIIFIIAFVYLVIWYVRRKKSQKICEK